MYEPDEMILLEDSVEFSERGANMPDITIVHMKADDLDFTYNLYCENNAFVDDLIWDEPILDADKHYNKHDFMEVLDDEKVRSFIAINKKVMSKNSNPYYLSSPVGFISYERLDHDKLYKIIFLEVKNKDSTLLNQLLKHLYDLAISSEKTKKLSIDIEDGRYDLMKVVYNQGFEKTKCLHTPNNNPDIFIFEKDVKHVKKEEVKNLKD